MWKINKSIAKELLPTQPVDFPIEPWWGVCLVNFTVEEFKVNYLLIHSPLLIPLTLYNLLPGQISFM